MYNPIGYILAIQRYIISKFYSSQTQNWIVINFNETMQLSHTFSFVTLTGLIKTFESAVFVKKSYSGNFAINLS